MSRQRYITIGHNNSIQQKYCVINANVLYFSGLFSIGSLIHVHASYPSDGDRARIDILRLDNVLQHDSVTRELKAYPGPLIKQV